MSTPAEALPMGVPSPLLRVLGWCVAVMLMAAALLPLVPRLAAPAAPLTLTVAGDFERVRPEAVRLAVAPMLQSDFYDLDLASVKRAVEALPWVAAARVERAWPAAVRIQVWEHRPYAHWGATALLSEDGVVFRPASLDEIPPGLPALAGPDGRHAAVRQTYEELRARLSGTPFGLAGLAQNERGEWTAVTTNGIELRLGRGTPLEAAALLAGPVRTALETRLEEVSYVDLHYVNGFAVGWRESGAAGAGPGAVGPLGGDE